MLIRYGGPNLQMDFVSFVHLMLRAEKMEGEPAGRRGGQGFLCTPCGLPTCPQLERQWGAGGAAECSQCRSSRPGSYREHWLRACVTWLHLPKLIYTLPVPEAKV